MDLGRWGAILRHYPSHFPARLVLQFRQGMIAFVILAISVISFLVTNWAVEINHILRFYTLSTRFRELGIGSLIAFLPKPSSKSLLLLKLVCECIALLGIGAILFSISFYHKLLPNPSFFTLMPTSGTALLLLFSEIKRNVGGSISVSKRNNLYWPCLLQCLLNSSAFVCVHKNSYRSTGRISNFSNANSNHFRRVLSYMEVNWESLPRQKNALNSIHFISVCWLPIRFSVC